MAVRIEVNSENVVMGRQAKILVYEDDKLISTIMGEVETQQGADGGHYPAVKLKEFT